MGLRDLLKSKVQAATKRVLRAAFEVILDEDEDELTGSTHGHQKGQLNYTFTGQFMEGTDLRTMLSGAAAFTSLWVKQDDDLEHLSGELLMPGPYQVQVKMEVTFAPFDVEAHMEEMAALEDLEENGIPVYDAEDLIKALQQIEED